MQIKEQLDWKGHLSPNRQSQQACQQNQSLCLIMLAFAISCQRSLDWQQHPGNKFRSVSQDAKAIPHNQLVFPTWEAVRCQTVALPPMWDDLMSSGAEHGSYQGVESQWRRTALRKRLLHRCLLFLCSRRRHESPAVAPRLIKSSNMGKSISDEQRTVPSETIFSSIAKASAN